MRETAIFLTMDGVTNGAIYALIALGIILSVSRGEQDASWEQRDAGEKKRTVNAKAAA